ncbi:DNA polymerase III subunit alpha [Gracilibacillus dipsosauri]|uniref:DNA polymerase III subunit alpha n=1 Tax=Gracilibacillus dipsosauri TaxID=178340 RepID=A0A317L0P9_9BACI|nr:DNA polymerase III subunit alpha [Gracilibacillus dipsosauri]PWU69173.1 DNA polymerase III subunit alpha [Gracilibacillus dipsosauri]
MTLAQLQIKSSFSFLKSMVQIDELVQQAKNLNYDTLALTDESVLHGAISFYQACEKAGIKPIIGMEASILIEEQLYSFLLLAKNESGYKELIQLSSLIQQGGVCQLDGLREASENFILVLPISPLIEEQKEWFDHLSRIVRACEGFSLYLGISPNTGDFWPMLQEWVRKTKQKAVALPDVRYVYKNDALAYSCLEKLAIGDKWDPSAASIDKHLYLRNEQELKQIYQNWPELLEEASSVAKKCQIELKLDQRLLPKYPLAEGQRADDYLEKQCHLALSKKYDNITDVIVDRLHYELDVIHSMGFSDYFLIVSDFVRYAKESNIMVGPGRGSAAGSLVAYLLGITNVDPLEYGLLFERFLNPERVSMPDIDIDFSDEKRDQVIQYVSEKYGVEQVAQIITFGTFAARSILRELSKTMEIPDSDLYYILKKLPKESNEKLAVLLKKSPELIDYVKQSEKLKILFKVANRLEGLPRHHSTHAAGVIISDQPLTKYVPVMPSQNQMLLTQYPMNDLEKVGLLKFDFLGLRNLTLIERICSQINHHSTEPMEIDAIPLDDANTFSLLREGRTNGVFQLESQGMKQVLRDLKPTNLEDIVAVNALYRPGPMQFISLFINRKHGKEEVHYLHPDLGPILAKTYGVLVYQEQIMQIANKMANFSYGEADLLRRAVSKKEKNILLEQKEKFLQGCQENQYPASLGEEVFEWILRFSNYGFNRSHAVAYSMIAYQLAYLKANYPLAFFAEMLSMQMGNADKMQSYIREATNQSIKILPPSINRSIGKFKVEDQSIRMGLSAIKGIGFQIVQEILQARKEKPFKNIFDFCLRVPTNRVKRSAIESLILAGAFDETYSNRATLLASLDDAIEQGELFRGFDDQLALFQGDLALDAVYVDKEPFPPIKQLMMEKEVVGFFVSTHPLTNIRTRIGKIGYLTIQQAKYQKSRKLKLAAVVQTLKVIRTKKGESMAFITIADETDELEGVIFPPAFRKVNHWLKEEEFAFVHGRVENRGDKLQIIAEDIQPLVMEQQTQSNEKIFIQTHATEHAQLLDTIGKLAQKYPGLTPVFLYRTMDKKLYKLDEDYHLNSNWHVIKVLKQHFGEENVVLRP